jgi:hypothetical protein
MNFASRILVRCAAAMVVATSALACGPGKASLGTDNHAPPIWATLDPQTTGNAEQRLTVLASRLEAFLRGSIDDVNSQVKVGFSDPIGRMACASTTSLVSRQVVISGVSGAQLRLLHDKLLALWAQWGDPSHHVEHSPQGSSQDTITVHGFGIEDSSYPDNPLVLIGSTPCVPNDSGSGLLPPIPDIHG